MIGDLHPTCVKSMVDALVMNVRRSKSKKPAKSKKDFMATEGGPSKVFEVAVRLIRPREDRLHNPSLLLQCIYYEIH
jgi:hypothetical protein